MNAIKTGGKYKFTTKDNFEDYSSGRVLYGVTGATNFPVRLISEIFQRSKEQLEVLNSNGPYNIYDPFCGAGYSITVLGFLHGDQIKSLTGSDINSEILDVAKKNLSLLSRSGLESRIKELEQLYKNFTKQSHKDALISASRLGNKVDSFSRKIKTQIFQQNVLEKLSSEKFEKNIDLVITDLPYGKLTNWSGVKSNNNLPSQFIKNIKPLLNRNSVLAISFNKQQEVDHIGYKKLKGFKIGTRKVLLLTPL